MKIFPNQLIVIYLAILDIKTVEKIFENVIIKSVLNNVICFLYLLEDSNSSSNDFTVLQKHFT